MVQTNIDDQSPSNQTRLHRRLTNRFSPEEFEMLRTKYSYLVGDPEDCWIWPHYRDSDGYGVCNLRGKTYRITQVMYELYVGEVPEGLVLRHTCDTSACCNYHHLRPGTHADNSRDMVLRGRSLRGEKNAMAKLTWDTVGAIRKMAKNGSSRSEIAQKYPQVAPQQIYKIIKGEAWREDNRQFIPQRLS